MIFTCYPAVWELAHGVEPPQWVELSHYLGFHIKLRGRAIRALGRKS